MLGNLNFKCKYVKKRTVYNKSIIYIPGILIVADQVFTSKHAAADCTPCPIDFRYILLDNPCYGNGGSWNFKFCAIFLSDNSSNAVNIGTMLFVIA